jgi:uncharacterized protein (DUF58 family)
VNLDLARLNHILIPSTKEGRDRLRQSRLGRLARPLERLYLTTTPDGQLLAMLAIFAGLFGLDARHSEAYLLSGLIASLMAASFLVGTRSRLSTAAIQVTAPPRVALGEPISFTVICSNHGEAPIQAIRLRGPFLPYDGTWMGDPPVIGEVGPHRQARVELGARFARRGQHHLDPFGMGALVPLGLTTGPVLESAGVRFLVVPRVAPVARLPLPLGRRYQPGGVALASRTGDSSEFHGIRPYRPGDAARDLHARTWARVGEPVVRERQQEFFSRVAVVVDTEASAASARALESVLSLAAGVTARLMQGEALVDLLVANGEPSNLVLGRSLGHLEQALDLLACVEGGAALDPDALLARLETLLPRLSSLLLLALTWDERRRRFLERVRAAGVGCRVLLVGEGGGAEATAIPVAAIERGEALWL